MEKTQLNYRVIGNGHPVVFLHGFLESITMWDYLTPDDFPFQSILIDLPGHGSSLNDDDSDPTMLYMAKKVLEVLEELNIDEFDVVGHSMGGYVALQLKEISSKCNRVVLLNSNFWEDTEEKKRDRLRVAEIVFRNKNMFIKEAIPNLFADRENYSKEIAEIIEEAIAMNAHAVAYASLAMRCRANKRFLLEINPKDFLLIQGENDSLIPVETMHQNIDKLGISYQLISRAGHMSHIESTEKVKSLIRDFLI